MPGKRSDILFSTQPVTKSSRPPVIIVGLPRSGSSFLAHISSQLDNWFIFDDLYLYREAESINAISLPLTTEQLEKLLFFLGWQIRARIKYGIFCVPQMTINDVEPMNDALMETFRERPVYWHELQQEWMTRLTLNQNCKYWGYKAPQDFQITDIYEEVYPDVKYIFLYRDPRKMLRSLKYVSDQDGNSNQYHPIIYSQYWKKAVKVMKQLADSIPNRVLNIKYEDLVKNTQYEADRIATYLDTSMTSALETSKTNTSFTSSKKQELSPTELKICEMFTEPYLSECGYSEHQGQFRIRDIPNFIKSTAVFTFFQIKRLASSKSARVSVLMFLKNIFK